MSDILVGDTTDDIVVIERDEDMTVFVTDNSDITIEIDSVGVNQTAHIEELADASAASQAAAAASAADAAAARASAVAASDSANLAASTIAARNIIAGTGLTGGGTLTADVTLNVGVGTGLAVAADAVSLKPAAVAEIGGVKAVTAVSHQWVATINTDGSVTLSQPAFSDISGTVAATQLPAPTTTTIGGVKAVTAVANQWVATINTDGSVTLSQPSFANISGSVAATQMPALTGDVTTTAGAVATTIANNAVTNAKAAQMAANTLKGNNTGGAANALDLTVTQATAMLNAFGGANGTTGGTKGLVPAPAATDNVKFLRGDGTFATPAGAGDMTKAVYDPNLDGIIDYAVLGNVQYDLGLVNAVKHGADPTGVADSTSAIQAAINTGKNVFLPAGTYKLTDALTFATANQFFFGAGEYLTILSVAAASFNMAATGVLVVTAGDPGPRLENFRIKMIHASTTPANRAALSAFPPAIYMVAKPRVTVRNVMITNCMIGIKATGNTGGSMFDNLKISPLQIGIDLDGAQDTVRINDLHVWPFDMTTQQSAIFYDNGVAATHTATIGIRAGRVDGLFVRGGLLFSGRGMELNTGTGGNCFGTVSDTAFDNGFGFLSNNCAGFNVTGCYFTAAVDSYGGQPPCLQVLGGDVQVTGCWFSGPSTLGKLFVAGTGVVSATACRFDTGSVDVASVVLGASGAVLTLGNCQFKRTTNTAYGTPAIYLAAGEGTVNDCRCSAMGTGSGNFIQVDVNAKHNVDNNRSGGFGYGGANWNGTNGYYGAGGAGSFSNLF
jgi:hypothetical protein